jgi:flagellum-specific peptidoglycan hydrolase FlgJ
MMTPDQFIGSMKQAALTSSAASLLPPGVTIAQAAIESAWGSKAPGNNYFGITGHGDLPDIPLGTHEDLTDAQLATELQSGRILKLIERCEQLGNGKSRFIVLRNFGAWSTIAANFAARDHMIKSFPVYAEALQAWLKDHDTEAYVRAFAKHWASDPHYADTIMQVYHTHGLAALDKAA